MSIPEVPCNTMQGDWVTQDIPMDKELVGFDWSAGSNGYITGIQFLVWKPI